MIMKSTWIWRWKRISQKKKKCHCAKRFDSQVAQSQKVRFCQEHRGRLPVISSSNIQKRKQSILNKAVSDFEKDPLNLSLEIASRKGIVRLAQILDYSFSVGKPKHQLLIAIFNCPEPRKFGRQPKQMEIVL